MLAQNLEPISIITLKSGKNNAKLTIGLGARGDNHHFHNHNHRLGEGTWSDQECGFCVGGQRHVI